MRDLGTQLSIHHTRRSHVAPRSVVLDLGDTYRHPTGLRWSEIDRDPEDSAFRAESDVNQRSVRPLLI